MVDKETIFQVLCGLMENPQFLASADKFNLTTDDFSTLFEKYVFAAIYNLYRSGAERISVVDIDNYFNAHPEAKRVFEQNNGIEVLQDGLDMVQSDNFNFYYQRLKKFNILTDLKKMNFDTSQIYCEDLSDPKAKEINDRFEELNVKDIFSYYKNLLMGLESHYDNDGTVKSVKVGDVARDLVERLGLRPEVGSRLQGDIFNTICRGARKGKFYIRTASSGTGKTRASVGDACYLAYPVRYNSRLQRWERNGAAEKTLFIATEQDEEEITTLILAYLTDLNEETILYGQYSEEEQKLINEALAVMEVYGDNFIVDLMPNPSIATLKATVREHWLKDDIENVFYDYIFSSPSLLTEFRDLRIREDVALGLLSAALKELAVELKVFVMSSTQTNSKGEDNNGLKNESVVRGARSIIDKCDVACVISRISREEEEMISGLDIASGLIPNQVMDIYKVRRGKYTNVKVWSYTDLGTCRKQDLFITDISYLPIEGFRTVQFMFEDNDSSILEFLEQLNNGKIEINEEEAQLKLEEIKMSSIEMQSKKGDGKFGGLF